MLYFGTSGWSYDSWKNDFYAGVKKKEWLEYVSRRFNAVEINASHYRLTRESTLRSWYERTPDEFVFALKGHRFLTHNKKLLDAEESIVISRDNAKPLGNKLRVVLWQLPQKFSCNLERLETFVKALNARWRSVRHVMELRETSWFNREVASVLREGGVANCISDAERWPRWDAVTTNLVYLRFHGHTRTYASKYETEHLRPWAERIRDWMAEGREVYAFFDNDAEGAAPWDALELARLVRE